MADHPEQYIDVRGCAYVVLALDIAPFVKPDHQQALEYLRGRAEFSDFLETTFFADPRFERDSAYRMLEQQGYELGVFDNILLSHHFAPTYQLKKEQVDLPHSLRNNVQFKNIFLKIWEKWDFWFRLSGNGICTVIMKLPIPSKRALSNVSHDVLGLYEPFDMDSARNKLAELQQELHLSEENLTERIESVRNFMEWVGERSMSEVESERPAVVWQMAVEVVRQFILACNACLSCQCPFAPAGLALHTDIDRRNANSLREQYTIFFFEEMTHYDKPAKTRQPILPQEFLRHPEYMRVISALLEGTLLEAARNEGSGTHYFYPHHSDLHVRRVIEGECSSWSDELCVLTDRSVVIYCAPPKEQKVVFPGKKISYTEYWSSIIRGIEFCVETRVLTQSVEQLTTKYLLSGLPLLENGQEPSLQHLSRLTNDIANATRLVSHLRTLTVPEIISQTSYAVSKFDTFMKQTGMVQILSHAETNLRDLTAIVQRYSDTNLEAEAQRTNEAAIGLSVMFSIFSLALSLLALPSYLGDWSVQHASWYSLFLLRYGNVVVGLFILGSFSAFVIAGLALIHVRQRRKSKHWVRNKVLSQ
jgi:hypothetical protein